MEAYQSGFRDNGRVDNNGSTPLIKVCDRTAAASFRDPSVFTQLATRYISDKIESGSLTSDDWNHWQVLGALNVLYLDGDLYFPDEMDDEDVDRTNQALAEFYRRAIANAVGDEPVNYFDFIPSEDQIIRVDDKKKGGFHVFLFYHRNISKEDRMNIYNRAKDSIINSQDSLEMLEDYGLEINDEDDYVKLFDPQPLKTATMLIPFATSPKANARQYRLADYNISDESLFVLPIKHSINDVTLSDAAENEPTVHNIFDQLFSDEENNEWEEMRSSMSEIAKETLAFFRSLQYMSSTSPYWTKLADHDYRIKTVYKHVYNWFYYVESFTRPVGLSSGNLKREAVQLTVRSLLPLVKLTVNTGEDTERGTFRSMNEHLIRIVEFSSNNQFKDVKDFFDSAYFVIKTVPRSQRVTALRASSLYSKITSGVGRELSTPMSETQLKKEKTEVFNRFCSDFTKTLAKGEKIIANFAHIISDIAKSFTNEIIPFRVVDEVRAGEDVRADMSFDDLHGQQRKDYDRILSCWLRFFVIFDFFNSPKSNVDAYRSAINNVVRRFVYQLTGNNGEKESYIYNIRQFDEIRVYPYNQWIKDNDSSMLINWFAYIYNKYLASAFRTENKIGFVNDFFTLVENSNAIRNYKGTIDIYPLTNFNKEMKQVATNIIGLSSFVEQVSSPTVIPATDDSCWFPMRNGLLEFVLYEENRTDGKRRGDVVFHKDNYSRLMKVQTNVLWNEYYSKSADNIPYQRVVKMVNEILPNREKRDYVLMNYAQTLHSVGQRDQVHQHYGTGAEGKSLLNHAILVMLGLSASNVQEVKNGDNDIYAVQHGLAQTLKAEALIQVNNSSHDSGGIAELIDCRFCTVQEPVTVKNGQSVKIDVNTIKALTGGSFMKVREIYEKAQSFRPKLFTTIQTNRDMGFNEVDMAVRRRTKTIYFTEKFLAESTLTEAAIPYDNPHVKKADPELARSIDSDVRYWEAMFQLLLPYAQEFIRENRSGLSDITCPDDVKIDTDKTISHSNGVMSWLSKNLVVDERSCVNFFELINAIDGAYARSRYNAQQTGQDFDREMCDMSPVDREDLIITSLMGRFAAHHLYKLRDRFWFDSSFYKEWVNQSNGESDLRDENDELINYPPEYPRLSSHESDDEAVDGHRWVRYFDENPINNVYTLESRYLDVPYWKNLIYIVGYRRIEQ